MCRIGAIKSKVPVEPAKALYLMLPQQEGHDNSGYAMVMQDLYGVFEGHKDKPLLSLACTPRGVRMVDAYMAEQGFEQVLSGFRRGSAARPRYQGIPCYVFRNYGIPKPTGRPQAGREELLLDTRLALRRMLERTGRGSLFFWPDVLTLKEIGDPRDIAAYSSVGRGRPLRASIVTQCRQNTNTTSSVCGASVLPSGLYPVRQQGKHVLYEEYGVPEVAAPGYVGFESDSQNFLHPALRAARTEVALSTSSTSLRRCPLRKRNGAATARC
ncbi:MAG: hypothetical protein ACLRWP_20940 [Bilophila wadsworthia]